MKKLPRLVMLFIFVYTSVGAVPAAGQESPGGQPDPNLPFGENALFLPLVRSNSATFNVTGQVTDENGNPLTGVSVSDGAGATTTTDADGKYTMALGEQSSLYSFSPEKGVIGFTPSNVDVAVESDISNLDFIGMSECAELISNGGFETNEFWELGDGVYDTTTFNTGARSLRLGPAGAASGAVSAMSPAFAIPSDAPEPLLRVWLHPNSATPGASAPAKASPADNFFGPQMDASDSQAVKVLDANGGELETLWLAHGQDSPEGWGLVQYSLTKYKGQTVRIGFFVVNDGAGSVSSLNVDDVSVGTCPIMYAPDDDTARDVSAPSAPAACANQIINPGFETTGGWGIPYTAYPARYTNQYFYTSPRSMQTGILYPPDNRYSYSDAWQTVYIPLSADTVTLSLYNKMYSTEAPAYDSQQPEDVDLAKTDPHFAPGAVWGSDPLASDSMYVLILDPYSGVIIQTLRTWTARNNDWKQWSWDLSAYRGRSIRIQFGTYNDGWNGVTAMFVDEFYIYVCNGVSPTPTPPPSVTCPPGSSERLLNTQFENNSGWYIPVTAYSARYSTLYANSGTRSMQTGILNPYHNRFSYSDFGQYTVVPAYPSSAQLTFYGYFTSGDVGYDKQYLLVLDTYGYWIDTLMMRSSYNSAGWEAVTKNLASKWYANGFPFRLQFGTYNNGYGGVTSMFVDDVTLCTYP